MEGRKEGRRGKRERGMEGGEKGGRGKREGDQSI